MRPKLLLTGLLMMNATAFAAPTTRPVPAEVPFGLSAVRLLDGPFKRAQSLDGAYLLSLDIDRLLTGFRANGGLATEAKAYGGWESRGLAGNRSGITCRPAQ